jgi:hypothetical protein
VPPTTPTTQAARCEYFERLLFGSLREASAEEIRLHASSEAFRHVLVHLHTGNFGSLAGESCWITLMEASSLAQQYILPGMVQHVADRLSADLSPANLGLALSHALKVTTPARHKVHACCQHACNTHSTLLCFSSLA